MENSFPELSKISSGTISKILAASNVKTHKISSYLAPIDPEFEPKSAVVPAYLQAGRIASTDYQRWQAARYDYYFIR
jgi:hypothetical protein